MPEDLVLYTVQETADLLRLHPQVVQRKLAAAEIPGYRLGREWRVERSQLIEWLEQHSNKRAPRSDDEKVMHTFFDEAGRLVKLPAKRSRRDVVLRHLVAGLEPDRSYPEREINAHLRRFHDDVASLRRELVMTKQLVRTRNGVYKRVGPSDPALHRA